MGFDYPIVMAIVITACIAITIFIISDVLVPYIRVVTSYTRFDIISYYVSSNFVSLVIYDSGNTDIKYLNVTFYQNSIGYIKVYFQALSAINEIKPRQTVDIYCTGLSNDTWKCYISIRGSLKIVCNESSLCYYTYHFYNTNGFEPGIRCYINIFVRFGNELSKTENIFIVPVS